MSEEAAFRRGVVEALGLAAEMATKLGSVDELVSWCRQQASAAVGPCPVCREPRGHHRDLLTGRFVRGPRQQAGGPAVVTLDKHGLVDEVGLLTLKEAAAAAQVSVEAVRLWVKRGQVVSVKHHGRVLVGERSLYDCELARRSTPGGRPRAPRQEDSGD